MKKYFIFIIIIIFAIPIQSYSADTTYTHVKLQLKWKHQFQFAGYYAAIEQGYYKELGIEVELIEANTSESPIDALINGNAQFATGTSDIVLQRAAGKPVVLLSTIFQHSAQILLVSDTSKIEYVHNLSDKRLIIEPHAADIIAYMKDEGVPLNRVIQMPHSFNINMLIENKADAMTAYLTDEPFLLQQQNFDYKIFSPISGNIDFYGDILITTEQLLKDNPKLAMDFRAASLKGWEYAMNNTDEIIELIYNKYSKRHSKEHLTFEAEKMKKLILANVVPLGYSNPRRWEQIIKIYQETGLLDAKANTNGLFYTDYINKLNIPWKIIIPFSIIFLFLSSTAFIFYRITKKLKTQIKQNKSISNTLIKTEKQYQIYFDQGMLGMAKTSLEKGWLEVNDVICNMFGYTREEFFELTWDKMTYPDDLEKDLLQFERVLSGEIDNYSIDKRFFRKNGEIFYSSLTVNAVRKADGSIDYMIAILNDITEQKKAEEALKNSEAQLKEINITKDKFFSIIAHDLKSPFNAILGFSEILLENHKEYDDEKREKMIKIVNSSAVRAFKLVENLLEWSRSHTGNIAYQPEKLYLKNVLLETLYNHESQADKKSIKITDTIHENELIFADNNMVATVLRNLISNAIKFTQKNGNIVISSENQTNSNFLKISVTDTGVGISKDEIDDLFRIDKDTSTEGTENETGTGLGLIICKEFTEKHGGKIWAESEEEKGSTFNFTVPIKNKNETK